MRTNLEEVQRIIALSPHDIYGILNIEIDAAVEIVKTSYRKLSLKVHPDKHPDNVKIATEAFRKLNEAYEKAIDAIKFGKPIGQLRTKKPRYETKSTREETPKFEFEEKEMKRILNLPDHDYYKILGIDKAALDDEIKLAFNNCFSKIFIAKCPPSLRGKCLEAFVIISHAANMLSDSSHFRPNHYFQK